ncbi:hypothetical protein SAMN05421837_10532 [Amycolatopsis pretoriensis]|uniref:Uncharacterized protein n=1 Tax=Amycolatopsis pretoriensis TaxID=218821 RepID=A0A1H5QVM0_9PSEU|nr:hypothetical protein [Amycolatopsis pretoriensis]SEF30153.1 hypothetical protein SAMN05421837_10532 [Amycolatopsis pretoriensis]
MTTQYAHIGKKSWWSGNVKTLCGLILPPGNAKSVWFPAFVQTCPGCLAVQKNGGK